VADDKNDVHQTLAYGSERYMIRHVPPVALLLLLGIATQVWPAVYHKPMSIFVGFLLAAASFAYIAFACFRYFIEPGRPRLVLSTDGIRQRLSHGRILHIPWDEVQGVVSVDHAFMTIAGMVHTMRDVPAIVVSTAFYDRVMPHQPFLRRPLNWGHFAQGNNGAVRILFPYDYLGTRAQDLRQAIETRWRAFSRHPNAKLPQREEPRRKGLLPPWLVDRAPLIILALFMLIPIYFLWRPAEFSEGSRSGYLGDLLDKSGVTARLADGRMDLLRRWDIGQASIPQCDVQTTREAARLWTAYVSGATCTAHLTLLSGARAVAVFRIGLHTYTTEYQLGKFREQSALVAVPLSLEEADTLLCGRGHCGPGSR
jgi:hypothetical protein